MSKLTMEQALEVAENIKAKKDSVTLNDEMEQFTKEESKYAIIRQRKETLDKYSAYY